MMGEMADRSRTCSRTDRTRSFVCCVYMVFFLILSVPHEKEGDEFCYQSILWQTPELMHTLMMLLTRGCQLELQALTS